MTTPRLHAVAALSFAILAAVPTFGQQKPDALKIVVLAGEDAVNVVQQKTAVAPIVEVRDRNNQPVSGAAVTFAIRSGRATLSGSRTLTVTTNAAGRAVASGLTPTGAGALKIGASATFQGQSAAVTIAQTNVMTAAQAAAMSGAGASAGTSGGTAATAGGTAGGSGSGLSATTIAIVGGAAAGGVVATNTLLGGFTTYEGDLVGDIVETPIGTPCRQTFRYTGRLIFQMRGDTEVSGTVNKEGDSNIMTASTCQTTRLGVLDSWGWLGEPNLQGTTNAIRFHAEEIGASYAGYFDFFGSLQNGVITGTLTVTNADPPSAGGAIRGGGVLQVTLR